jgi:hypothetical protein
MYLKEGIREFGQGIFTFEGMAKVVETMRIAVWKEAETMQQETPGAADAH